MANEKREQARQLWEASGGTLPLKEIAARLGVPLPTVKSWKQRDRWGKDAWTRTDASKGKDASRKHQARANATIARALDSVPELEEWEKEFCLHYVQCYNAAQAAMRTGRYSSYASAKQSGYVMLHKPAIQAEIKRLKVLKRTAILADGDDLIELCMRIAFADMTDVVAWAYNPVLHANQMAAWPSHEVDGQLVAEVSETAQGFKIKMVDRKMAFEILAQYFLLNPLDKHKIEFDRRRMALEERKAAEGNEEALSKLDELMAGVDRVMQDGG